MVQWVKDLALLQLWDRPQLWLRFDPWPKNFCMLRAQPKEMVKVVNFLLVFILSQYFNGIIYQEPLNWKKKNGVPIVAQW